MVLETEITSDLLREIIPGPLVLVSSYSNFSEVGELVEETSIYSRVTLFTESNEEIVQAERELVCERVNVNGFERVAIPSLMNSLEKFGMDKLVSIQSIIDADN